MLCKTSTLSLLVNYKSLKTLFPLLTLEVSRLPTIVWSLANRDQLSAEIAFWRMEKNVTQVTTTPQHPINAGVIARNPSVETESSTLARNVMMVPPATMPWVLVALIVDQ